MKPMDFGKTHSVFDERYIMLKLHFVNMDEQFAAGLYEIAPQLDIVLDETGIPVVCEKGDSLCVSRDSDGVRLVYSRMVEFYRALSLVGGLAVGDRVCRERQFGMLCYMADMSRNAVFNVKACKRMLRYLALMGYDSMMLYTEDTYEITEYPCFGRMRGRFSQAELRELDDYAYALGIELIPCIQALAHLGSIFRWQEMSSLCDMNDILLVGEEKTYDLVRSMIKTCASCFRSRRIHLGMDEAHNLGRGKYLDRNGVEKSSDIMLKHLARVTEICREFELSPMIWSDMFFRMQFGRYYVKEGEITPEVVAKVPEGLGLVYWDYYTKEPEMLSHMIHCHKQFDRPVYFAGGAWKWSGSAPHNMSSNVAAEAQLNVCLAEGVTDIIVTGWGDDGAEASQFSVLPNLLYWAEKGYGNTDGIGIRSEQCFGIEYDEFLKLDLPDRLPGINEAERPRMHAVNPSKYLLYNDPLEGLFDAHIHVSTAAATYREHARTLLAKADDASFGLLFDTLGKLCRVLSRKCDLSIRIRNAYLSGDRETLTRIAGEEIGQIVADLEAYTVAFRRQWYDENKPHGFSVQEIRLGGLRERLVSTKCRLRAYLAGEIERIDELHEPFRTLAGNPYDENNASYAAFNSWARNATACVISHSF